MVNNTSIQQQIDSILNVSKFNGVVHLERDKNVVYYKAVGLANFKNQKELKKNDQFVIGSISKQITAVLVLQWLEAKRLKLTDTIGSYLTDLNQNWKDEITIHQLLTHTHGIINLNDELAFTPGSHFSYSQLGYHLLAQILEVISNKPFESLVADLCFKNNLNHTYHPHSNSYKIVAGYESSLDSVMESKYSLENYAAAGSMISNTTDLIRWNELLHGGELVESETYELMTSRYATRMHPIYGEVEYGYGVLFNKGQSDVQIGALGYAPGFVSSSYYFPQTKYNMVILENVAQGLPDFKKAFQTQINLLELVAKLK